MVALLVRDEIQGEGGTVKPKWTLSLKLPDNIKLWPQLVVDDGTAPFLETGLFCGTEHVQVHVFMLAFMFLVAAAPAAAITSSTITICMTSISAPGVLWRRRHRLLLLLTALMGCLGRV